MTRSRTGKRLATIGLGLALVVNSVAPASPPAPEKIQVLSYNKRAFRIPFNINPTDRSRYKQLQLWVSGDGGGRWDKVDTTNLDSAQPEHPTFSFKANRDGEFWFAVRTLDTKNRLIPADDADVEPIMKVTVDTLPPQISLEALPRRGSIASVRWEVVDEHIDLGTLVIEYQAVGARDWAQVPIQKLARIGRQTWDAGTSEPLKVRASVSDKAGNLKAVSMTLRDGIPDGSTGSGDLADPNVPPPRSSFASSEGDRSAPTPIASELPAMPRVEADPGPGSAGRFNPFASGEPSNSRPAPSAPTPEPSNPPIPVSNPKFGLKYEVDDAGPNGPAAVELYVTTDNGRTWYSRGEDPDKTSPFPVDLGGEGTFGLKLVAKSAANQGDQPPSPGELPKTIVEVDSTGPNVKLEPIRVVGSKAIITWHANDPHPAARPVLISVKPDSPGSDWQLITPTPIENTGQYTWVLPQNCPPRIHFRVDVVDALNNRSSAETTETGSILVDRTKPKGRIIGLDQGTGPAARTNR